MTTPKKIIPRNQLESLMFASRWFQVPMYLGLVIALVVYVYEFGVELVELVDMILIHRTNEKLIVINALDLIDVVLVANLIVMVIVGGYETFVSKLNLEDHPDQPEWLEHVNPTTLKVKLALSIITIGSIHLLKTFIDAANISAHTIMWQVIIQVVFVFCALGVVMVDRLGSKGH